MSLLYVGNVEFEETADSGLLEVDPWGADMITRIYEGRTSLLYAFRTQRFGRSRRVRDTTYPQLFVTEIRQEVGRSFSKLITTAKGIINGKPPEPVIRNSTQQSSVTLEYGTGSGITSSFQYNSPVREYVYYSQTDPLVQRFPGLVRTRGDAFRVTSQTGAPGAISVFKGRSLSAASIISSGNITATPSAYNAVAECNGTMESEPIGLWFRVTERNVGVLVPLDFANSPYTENLTA